MAEKKKNQMLPFKELPVRFKVLRIVFVCLELPGMIMAIVGTALGVAGIGVLISGILTFLVPGLIVAIIDFKLETKYRNELEAKKANGEAPAPEAKAEPAPVIENKPEPQPELAPASDGWVCPNCGAHVKGNFCVECGTKKPEPQPEPVPAPAPVVEEVEPVPEPAIEEPVQEEPSFEPEPQPVYQANDNNGDPERKTSKKGLILVLIIVGALVLVGGGVGVGIALANKKNKNNEDGPRDDDYSYVVPASSSTPKSSSSSARPSSSSAKPTTSAVTSKTPKQTMADICDNIFARGARYYDDYPEDYNYFYSSDSPSGFYAFPAFGSVVDPVESNLRAVVEAVANNLPDYLAAENAVHSDTWSDGEPGYFQTFADLDKQCRVELGSFIETDDSGTDIYCRIYVTFYYQ